MTKVHVATLISRAALALLLGSTLSATRAKAKPAAPNSLVGTKWELTSPVYEGLEKRPLLSFNDTNLGASAGCNSIGGAYEISGEKINIGPLISTRMACAEPIMRAEEQYSKALQNARNFEITADGQTLTLRGGPTLTFHLTGHTAPGFAQTGTKILNVAPQLGPELDGDRAPRYLQLEDLSDGASWGRFTAAKIEGFNFVPGYRYQLRVAVERDARTQQKRLRLLEIFSQQWMKNVRLAPNRRVLEVAPTPVDCAGKPCLQVREAGGAWFTLATPIAGFDYQADWRYRLLVTTHDNDSQARYKLVRLLDKLPVIR